MILNQDLSRIPSLAEGGEGIIYEYKSNIIKLYKSNVNISSKQKKIQLLMKKQLPKEVIKPTDEVYNQNKQFVGYMMDKVTGEDFKKLSNKKFIVANNITTKDILSMLVKIQNVLVELHKQNIYIGDLNDQNILFDSNLNVFFIDCDSWAIDSEKCEVAMDLFKDPLLKADNFNSKTDTYSFCVLAWKALTRIHPFGGIMNPDINIIDRMNKGLSVIDNSNVTIPRTIKSWNNLSPNLIDSFKKVFENKSRKLENQLGELLSDLKFCDIDKEYYYGKFTTCPLCDKNAKVILKPISQGIMGGLHLIEILNKNDIKTIINESTYLDKCDFIVDVNSGKKAKYEYGNRYYFTSTGILIEDKFDCFIVHSDEDYVFDKKFKTSIVVEGNNIYFVSKQNSFTEVIITRQGNGVKSICKCSNNSYFGIEDSNYCILNYYTEKLIVNINGSNCEIKYSGDIINYGIHYDKIKNKWLVIIENSSGVFTTYIIDKNTVVYNTEKIKYDCQLANVCFSNNVIFIPINEKIRGFAFEKSVFKDFECSVVDPSSLLKKRKNNFVIINNENIYNLGK